MRGKWLRLWFMFSVLPAVAAGKTPSNFSGQWVLDFNQTKNPPSGLESYNLTVNQDGQQLKVETTIKGNLQPNGGNSPHPVHVGGYPYPGGYPGGMGPGPMWPRGGRRMPAGEGQAQRLEGAALKVYPPSAIYKLDGTPSTAKLGDREHSDATAKAEWAKGGKQLKLTLVGEGAEKSGQAQLKDEWKLDGQNLKIDRNIHTPNGSKTIHLVFRKES